MSDSVRPHSWLLSRHLCACSYTHNVGAKGARFFPWGADALWQTTCLRIHQLTLPSPSAGDLIEGKPRTPLSSRVATRVSWSPLSVSSPSPPAPNPSHQFFLTLCDPIDGSPPGSPIPGILQARTLEWTAISFSNVHFQEHTQLQPSPAA